jgi:hypothetical protein
MKAIREVQSLLHEAEERSVAIHISPDWLSTRAGKNELFAVILTV